LIEKGSVSSTHDLCPINFQETAQNYSSNHSGTEVFDVGIEKVDKQLKVRDRLPAPNPGLY
jgi:hypothetical protein